MISVKGKNAAESLAIESSAEASPGEELVTIPVPEGEGRTLQIGSGLGENEAGELIEFLMKNLDVFAWSPSDMLGVDPEVAEHRLHVNPKYTPVKQKRRTFNQERRMAIQAEVQKGLNAGHLREAHHPEWVANVVMVPKKDGKWRMCVDFTNLNKACPMDSFPPPWIDQIVDATSGHDLLSFLDAYSGYHQIRMHPDDEGKTSFTTDLSLYCYTRMPFGLKNAGATYQRLVNKMFASQLGRNMEVYETTCW